LGLRNGWRQWRQRGKLPDLPDWIHPDFARRAGLRDRWHELNRPAPVEHPIHPVGHQLMKAPHWINHFEADDPGVTGVPVEFRHPFFDLRVIDCVFALAPLPWCIDKDLLRAAMRGLLPEPVRKRRKALLAGDPVQEALRSGRWNWSAYLSADSPVCEYVAFDKVVGSFEQFARSNGKTLSPAVHPLCLDCWLRSESRSILQPLPTEPYHAAV
jgi:asparagine synthase (glutamine-hydrolysing)